MPASNVNDPITDQEITFARLVLSATMTDRRAAEIAGLDPDSVANIKSKPRVDAYIQEHRATVQQNPAPTAAAADSPQLLPTRDQILTRLWQIGNLSPELTRGSLVGQMKALSLIVAIEGLIPDRRAASARNKPNPPITADIYESEWLPNRRSANNVDLEPGTPQAREAAASEPSIAHPDRSETQPTDPPQPAETTVPTAAVHPAPTPSLGPRVPMADHVAPDTRVPFFIKKNRFGPRR